MVVHVVDLVAEIPRHATTVVRPKHVGCAHGEHIGRAEEERFELLLLLGQLRRKRFEQRPVVDPKDRTELNDDVACAVGRVVCVLCACRACRVVCVSGRVIGG